jgi:predicted transcriptional regulator YdeE
MNKSTIELSAIKLVGVTARTNNAAEMKLETAKIGTTMQKFFSDNIRAKILHRKNPGKVMAVYTNYASDFTGDYTYFIGGEVTSFEGINEGLESMTIPPQSYTKFTSAAGAMPNIVIDMWQQIWQMQVAELGGERAYVADFEIYDERSHDPQNAIVDVYIGIKR